MLFSPNKRHQNKTVIDIFQSLGCFSQTLSSAVRMQHYAMFSWSVLWTASLETRPTEHEKCLWLPPLDHWMTKESASIHHTIGTIFRKLKAPPSTEHWVLKELI
jgi:hypothetical protein